MDLHVFPIPIPRPTSLSTRFLWVTTFCVCASGCLLVFLWQCDHHGVSSALWVVIRTINPKGNQSWIFIRRTDAEAEASILWPPEAKSQFIRKDPDAERMKAGGEGDGRGWDGWMASVTQWTWVWASSGRWREAWRAAVWGHKELDTTEWLNNSLGTTQLDVTLLWLVNRYLGVPVPM